ncbi:MAG: dipeptidyl aminopeptidase, partial [Verrucomicrobia bacterium]
ALPYQGRPTKVFAWLGYPTNRTGRLPGIVLVHGGGGTAFKEWVERWNAHGFVAISIAVEGQTDERNAAFKDRDNPSGWKRHAWAGPRRHGIYGDSDKPLEDQWMYHAVADTILANSLLRSLPEVDPDKVGVMGISWGGVIVSTVIGIDPRFAFAIPTYGCGHLADAANQYGHALGNNRLYREVWDPMVRMHRVTTPTLWFSWPGDQHFPLDAQAACYRAAPGPHMVALVPGMRHGHGPGWRRPESYAFAKSVVQTGKPWCQQTGLEVHGASAHVRFRSAKRIDKAVLVSTVDTGFTGNRQWRTTPVRFEQKQERVTVVVALPPGTTAWFVNLHSGDLIASSDFVETKTPHPPSKSDQVAAPDPARSR